MHSLRKYRHLNLTSSVLLFSFSFLVIGYLAFGRVGLFSSLIVTLFFVYFMLFHEALSLTRWLAVKHWSGRDPWGVENLVHHFSKKLRTPAPQIALFDSTEPIVFTEAHNQTEGTLGISMGALERLTPAELEGLIALGLVHLQHQQQISKAILLKLVAIISFVATRVDRFLGLTTFKPTQRLATPLVWILTKIAFKQSDIYAMDKKAATLLPVGRRIGEALTKINNSLYSSSVQVPFGTEQYLLLKYSSPRHHMSDIHPRLEERLKRLVGFQPI